MASCFGFLGYGFVVLILVILIHAQDMLLQKPGCIFKKIEFSEFQHSEIWTHHLDFCDIIIWISVPWHHHLESCELDPFMMWMPVIRVNALNSP